MSSQIKKPAAKKHPKPSLKVAKKNDSLETVHSTEVVRVDNTPEGMIAQALSLGRSMEEIGQLITYRNNEIARLAKLDFIGAKKDFMKLRKRIVKKESADFGVNQAGKQGAKYKYEDLDAIDDAIREAAAECGLTYDWSPEYKDDFIYITCILSHVSGHSEKATMRGKADQSGGKNNIQADSSTISYLMRYTVKQVLGLSTGKDDNDGKDAAKSVPPDVILKLIKPDDAMWKVLVESVMKKTMTIAEIEKAYYLTEERLETLKTIQ